MKSRGCYETPGGTIMLKAHRAIESLTLDREVAHLKDELMPRYAELIYNGYWFSPERQMLQAAIDQSQAVVNGTVRVKLYKGNVHGGRAQSEDSLFDESPSRPSRRTRAPTTRRTRAGFIKLNALRLRTAAARGRSPR
jgi:argininosuccinate synthase